MESIDVSDACILFRENCKCGFKTAGCESQSPCSITAYGTSFIPCRWNGWNGRAGVYMFQLVDWYLATWSIMLICIGETIVFFWIYGGHRINRDIRQMLGRPLPALVRVSCAFIMPIFLLFLLAVSVYTYRPPTLGTYTYPAYATAIGWCFSMWTKTTINYFRVQ